MPNRLFYLLFGQVHFLYNWYQVNFYCCQYFEEISLLTAKGVDSDQTPRSAASDLCLHYLTMSHLWDARLKWVNPLLLARSITLNSGLRSDNRYVRGYKQTKANFPFICDSFRWTVVNSPKLFLNCLLAQLRLWPMPTKIHILVRMQNNMEVLTGFIFYIRSLVKLTIIDIFFSTNIKSLQRQ